MILYTSCDVTLSDLVSYSYACIYIERYFVSCLSLAFYHSNYFIDTGLLFYARNKINVQINYINDCIIKLICVKRMNFKT